jgi:hypothetical protein
LKNKNNETQNQQMGRNNTRSGPISMMSRPKKPHKESMKEKVGFLKRLTTLRQYDKTKQEKDPNKIRDEKGDITTNANEI